MNIAGKGVLLIVAVITIGVIVLNEGFSDNAAVSSDPLTSNQETQEQEQELEQEQEQESSSSSEETTEAVQDNADSETNEQSPATSTSVLHPPAEVRVLVANGTEVTGAAGATLDTLVATAGYNGVKAVNDTGDEVLLETFVYYGQGYDLDAQNVRLIINADSRNVLPMPETLPIDDLSDANVLVHVGSDLFPDQGG
jgi:cytoskeletal protein RodZ